MHRTSIRASTCKAFSVYKQSAQCQPPMHTLSTTNERNINAQSINNQCVLHQQPMRISPDSLMLGFSSPKTFTFRNKPLKPVILRGAEVEVAESILPESTLSLSVWGDRPQSPFSLCERSNFSPQRAHYGREGNACGRSWRRHHQRNLPQNTRRM